MIHNEPSHGTTLSNALTNTDSDSSCDIVIASYNIHGSVNGWGEPFDVLGTLSALDADIIVLLESWAANGEESLATTIGNTLGYKVHEVTFGKARLNPPVKTSDESHNTWGPRRRAEHSLQTLHDDEHKSRRTTYEAFPEDTIFGRATLAVLTRLPTSEIEVINLPRLWRERVQRKAVQMSVEKEGHRLTVCATHFGHLSHGSFRQMRLLRKHRRDALVPTALVGDMNCWGPIMLAMFPGWRRAVRGRTWPAWRPHSQIDHVLVRGNVTPVAGAVLDDGGSDHLPIKTTLRLTTT